MHISRDDILTTGRVLWSLPAYLRDGESPERAREILRHRFEQRETRFLAFARRAIYENPGSPYLRLLRRAGCAFGDLDRLVRRDGVEDALDALYRQGVYLTVDEFKGRRPVARGSDTFTVSPADLRNPGSTVYVQATSSGSRHPTTAVGVDLAFIREQNINLSLFLQARGGQAWRHAVWGVPGASAVILLLRLGACGRVGRWFSQVNPGAPGLHPRYRWAADIIVLASVLAGKPLPRPRYVSVEDPLPVARWMADVIRSGELPHLVTFPSAAVRLCQAVARAGCSLRDAQFTLLGEPLTRTRLAAVSAAGARAAAYYATVETGPIGYGCLSPEVPDEVHLLSDLHAVIQVTPDRPAPGLTPGSLLITSLQPRAPLVLLNVSLGDQATVARRACGCPLKALGWRTHLHTIRSHEKLTAGGVTLLDQDLIRVLEEVLPARFGGGPTHYQLVEREGADGRPILHLLVHPSLGPMDSAVVTGEFLAAIGGSAGPERVAALLWRESGVVQVERAVPQITGSGKILHLHQHPKLNAAGSSHPK